MEYIFDSMGKTVTIILPDRIVILPGPFAGTRAAARAVQKYIDEKSIIEEKDDSIDE